jgi:hypothetical protein
MTTNDLRHTATKPIMVNGKNGRIVVNIRLNDECKNGHQDFSITGDIYTSPTSNADRYHYTGGCIHDEIEKHFPQFKPFIKLHLCDFSGAPMYPQANGLYLIQKGFERLNGKTQKEYFCDYYRVSPEQYDVLKGSENKTEFAIHLMKLGIIDSWREEANKAIKLLEKLTGNEFLNDSKRSQFTPPTPEEIADHEKKVKEGYFTPEKKEERRVKALNDKREEMIKAVEDGENEKIEKAKIEISIKKVMINKFFELCNLAERDTFHLPENLRFFKNWIYYNHSNTICFNWNDSPYEEKLSAEQFYKVYHSLTDDEIELLPLGITIELEKGGISYTLS